MATIAPPDARSISDVAERTGVTNHTLRYCGLGAKLTFYPYSSALGAVVVPAASPIQTLADLKGRKLAVAGGPIDKSWLLLLAWLKQGGIDLKSEATIAYGAPR